MNLLPWNRAQRLDIHHDNSSVNPLQREVNRLFEDFFGGFDAPVAASRPFLASPAVDIVESGKGYKISAELPAMDAEDVDISTDESYLTIKGEKREEKEERNDDDTLVRSERYYGSYQRTISLPRDANLDDAEATFKKGVLRIEIPKKKEAQASSRKIEVKGAA